MDRTEAGGVKEIPDYLLRPVIDAIGHGAHDLIVENQQLRQLEWLVRDFVWSCPDIPEHPTAQRLVDWFEGDLKE
jgi:hypothetical protein